MYIFNYLFIYTYNFNINFLQLKFVRNERDANELDINNGNQGIIIDTGELVWSVAFAVATGRHRVNTTLGKPHYRYKVAGGIIIATGLASGRIRIWDATTGRHNNFCIIIQSKL